MSDIEALNEQLAGLQEEALKAFSGATDLAVLEQLRVAYLGKKGALTEVLKGVGKLPPEQRPVIGQQVNAVKQALATALDAMESELAVKAKAERIEAERLDVTLPGRSGPVGALHPVQQGLDEITAIFSQMGLRVHCFNAFRADLDVPQLLSFRARRNIREYIFPRLASDCLAMRTGQQRPGHHFRFAFRGCVRFRSRRIYSQRRDDIRGRRKRILDLLRQ